MNTQAGANQSQNLAALMRNYSTAIEATNTALDSAGSAAKENARWTAAMEGKLKGLASAWEDFSRKMVNSDLLKKGIDVLTKVLEALSSDVGQVIIKYGLMFAGVATGLKLVTKAAIGIKSLSLAKLFSGFAKGSKEAASGLSVMQAAQVGATKAANPLYGVFGKLTGSLLGSAGLVAGIGLLSVALAKYVPIGEKARDIKLGKELKEAQSDAEQAEKKYKSLCDELDRLHEKEKEGTLTDSEQNRLNILENQTKQYERQLELKNQIATNKADEYYHTVDPSKLEGEGKNKYNLAKSAGKSDKEALAAAGINDKIALSLNNVRARADEVTKAQEKVTEAYENHGKESKQYKSALEDLDKAQEKQGDVLTTLENKRKKAIEDYGSVKKANKALGDSWKELDTEISSLKALKGLNFKKPAKDIQSLKNNAKSLGLEFSKSGKKIQKIDLKSFSRKMTEAGYSVEDTWSYIKKLSKENPKIKVNIDGTDVAVEDLEFVDGKIQQIKKEKPKSVVTIDAEDNASATMKKIKADKNLGTAKKKFEENGSKNLNAKIKKFKSVKGLGQARKDITEHGSVQVTQKLKNIKSQNGLGTASKTISQNGYDSVNNKLNTLNGKTSLGTATKTINFSLSGAIAAGKKFFGFKSGVKHFASGGKSAIFDNAEVNEQGFEIIQDGKTGLMRVVNGGKRGTTRLNKGDSVYTHGQSVRMLQKSGMTENDVIHGHKNDDFALFGVNKLPGYKKGLSQSAYNKKYNKLVAAFTKKLKKLESKRDKKNWSSKKFQSEYSKLYKNYQKKLKELNKQKVQDKVKRKTSKQYKKKLAKAKKKQDKAYKNKRQKRYNKKYNALVDKYDAELATLEYKKEIENWSDETFNAKYAALKNKYSKKLKNLNKSKSIKGATKKKDIGTDRLRDYYKSVAQMNSEAAKSSIENYINGKRLTDKELQNSLNSITKQRKAKKISAQEAEEYRKEAYKKNLEYNLKEYKNDKKTYASMLALLKKRYNDSKITAEEYYEYLDDLAQTQLEKEKKRLTEQQTLTTNTYDLARSYVQRQIDLLEEENDEQKEQNELVELQNNLAKARNKRIRVYKEGEGFVYEQDTEAIREATDALKEYQKSSSAENPVLAKWKEVLQLFEDYETDAAIRALEIQVGSTVGKLFGSLGTDTSAWASWIKNNLSTSHGLQNVLDNMDKLVDTNDILAYLNSSGQISNATIQSAIANNALPATYAAAITQAALASSAVSSSGIGISQQSAIASATSGKGVSGVLSQYGNVYNFENLVLPNVTNATEFINELNNLSTTALQLTTQRV